MNYLWEIYKNKQWPEYYLLVLIVLCFVAIAIFLALLFYSRYKKIRDEKKIAVYNPIAEEMLFSLLFSNIPIPDLLGSVAYRTNIKNAVFKSVLLKKSSHCTSAIQAITIKNWKHFIMKAG